MTMQPDLPSPTRRHWLTTTASALLAACASPAPKPTPAPLTPRTPVPPARPSMTPAVPAAPVSATPRPAQLRLFASSGYGESDARTAFGLQRLTQAGCTIANPEACHRRHLRFAGTDAERIADLQDIATGRVPAPDLLMGYRGGYGAMRLLPAIDWPRLAARLRERRTLLLGFSDVTAIQLALLAQGHYPSFAGPMLYSEFGRPQPVAYTMQSFLENTLAADITLRVPFPQRRQVSTDGILWGGNLSILAALAGSPYMPDISGGLLFLEDVGEQPYRIERMLQTLHLAGILRRQQAIILGTFRVTTARDVYDDSYTLDTVLDALAQTTGLPILTGFPFGHIAEKATFPLGVQAQLRPDDSTGGYTLRLHGHPTLAAPLPNPTALFADIADTPFSIPVGGDSID